MSAKLQPQHDTEEPSADLIDGLIADWRRERPDLDPEPMAVVGRLFRVYRQLDARLAEILKPYGLRYSEFDVLATLLRSGEPYELTPTDLQQAVVLTSGAMTALLDRLTRQGLVARSQNKEDGRSKTAKLTRKGVQLASKLIALRFAEAGIDVECLSAGQKQDIVQLLKTLDQWLREAPPVSER
ncbi:MAG: MarR family transcriptional regulator [Pseudomonadota bacterium]